MSTESEEIKREPTRGSLLVVFLVVFIDLLGFGLVLPLLPLYAEQFTVDPAGWRLGLLMASFSIMQFIFAPLWGRLSDRIGRRPVLIIGLAGSVAFYTLFGVAATLGSLTLLFVSRIGAGIAGATISTAQAYIADTTTQANRQKGMALIGMAFGLGFTFGPLLGFLADFDGDNIPGPWPGYAAAGLSAVALVLGIFFLPESLTRKSDSAVKHKLNWQAFKTALSTPSVPLVLGAIFVCIFSFGNFETTLSLLIKGGSEEAATPFNFSWMQVCFTYAYIGLTLAIVQGGIVRRISNRVSEGVLAAFGAILEIVGFGLVIGAIQIGSTYLLLGALAVVVSGFSFMQPSLNSLLSRRSSPTNQGAILGTGQSVSAMARILGSLLGIPLFKAQMLAPYFTAAGLMAFGVFMVIIASRSGTDYSGDE